VQALTQQPDYRAAGKYWNKLKERLAKENIESAAKCHRPKLPAALPITRLGRFASFDLQYEREHNGQYTRKRNQREAVMSVLRHPVYLNSQGGDDDADNCGSHLRVLQCYFYYFLLPCSPSNLGSRILRFVAAPQY